MDSAEKNRLLLVDDDKSNLFELVHILQPEYKLYTAKNGASAIEQAKKHLPDLILLDIGMPGMSGFDVLAELKKSDDTEKIPVIFITGLNTIGDERKGFFLGASDYICKPFDDLIVKHRVCNQIRIVNLSRELNNLQKKM